ncbi:unnamed protein product [Phytomonas sp. Hart1]|nr:unnamed protein product [Phytomonas sp. Hart1]|eukprot:CCW71852.1 unnamed protein product [Phytomonas sp. isolate Hart1]
MNEPYGTEPKLNPGSQYSKDKIICIALSIILHFLVTTGVTFILIVKLHPYQHYKDDIYKMKLSVDEMSNTIKDLPSILQQCEDYINYMHGEIITLDTSLNKVRNYTTWLHTNIKVLNEAVKKLYWLVQYYHPGEMQRYDEYLKLSCQKFEFSEYSTLNNLY